MRRRAAAAFKYAAMIAAALLLLLPQATVTPPPALPQPQPPVAVGICDDVWAVDGFNTRFMVYDVVVDTPRFGPEVKGRQVSEVLDELRQRLCTDNALLVDLTRYVQNGFPAAKSSTRLAQIADVDTWTLEQRSSAVEQFMAEVSAGNPQLVVTKAAFASWFYRAGESKLDVPGIGVVTSKPKRSDFLVWRTKNGAGPLQALRLQCGFQPVTSGE